MSGGLRVVVADDHVANRTGVRRALEHGGFEVVAEASDGPAATAAAQRLLPDVCLLAVHMPGGGVATAADISSTVPDVGIVMLTAGGESGELLQALTVGARGYVLKDLAPASLPRAVHDVLAGRAPISGRLAARLVTELQRRGTAANPQARCRSRDGRLVVLSLREIQVLERLGEGLTTKQTAADLGLSPVTVRRHVSAASQRLRARSRDEAIQLAAGPSD